MFAKMPPSRKKDPVGPKKVEKPAAAAAEDETSPGKENRMNEAVEGEEAEAEVEAAKGKKKRGAAARAESRPKRKRIQVDLHK